MGTGTGTAGEVRREEPIARYIPHGSWLHADTGRAKPRAYLPNKGKTSVFRVSSLDSDGVRRLGAELLKNPPPLAHAIGLAHSVYDCGLRFDPNNEPPRHADIVGWPERKDQQKLLAMKLAEAAEVTRYA